MLVANNLTATDGTIIVTAETTFKPSVISPHIGPKETAGRRREGGLRWIGAEVTSRESGWRQELCNTELTFSKNSSIK